MSIPRAGWLCAVVACLNAIAWSLLVPLFQVPDETAHVAYSQHLAETGKPPRGERGERYDSPEQRALLRALDFKDIAYRSANRPLNSEADRERGERITGRDRSAEGEGGYSFATDYPPGYYALTAAAYTLSPSSDLVDRVHVMRLVSALLAGLTVLLVFLFLRELLPATPWAWTVGALAVAFQPMFGFLSGGVNNDDLLYLAGAAVFLCFARAFRRGLTVRSGAVLGGCLALGMLAKFSMAGLIPGAALGLLMLIRVAPPERRREALMGAAAAGAALAAPLIVYALLNTVLWDRGLFSGAPSETVKDTGPETPDLGGIAAYLWQFYLPRLPFMRDQIDGGWAAGEVWFGGSVGRFGWLDYGFPIWVYLVAGVVMVGVAGLAAWELYLRRGRLRALLPELVTYGAMTASLLLLVHWVGWGWRQGHDGGFEQGRYLFPLLAIYAAVAALAARAAARRFGPAVGILFVAAAIAHSVTAQLLTLTRYFG